MKHAKGQASIFVVLAVISLLLLLLIIPLRQAVRASAPQSHFASFITDCLRQEGIQAIREVAEAGGTFSIGMDSAASENTPPPIRLPVPTPALLEVQHAIEARTQQRLDLCYSDFLPFKQQGIAVDAKEPHITATITKDLVLLTLDQPILFQTRESSQSLNRFHTGIPTPLSDVIHLAHSLQETTPDGIDTTLLLTSTVNATIFAWKGSVYAVLEFPLPSLSEPGTWWVRIPSIP